MKILFINNTTTKSILSGGEIRFYNILNRIRNKIDYSIGGLFSQNKMNAEFKIVNKTIRRYAFYDKFSLYISYILRTLDILINLFFKNEKFDILYATSDFFPDVIPAFLLKSKKNKWIQIIHHIYPKKREGNYLKNKMALFGQKFSLFLIRKRADKIITVNKNVMNFLIKLNIDRDKIFVSSNGIDLNFFDKIPELEKKYDGIFMARLNYSKGVMDLIEIWNNVCLKYNNAKLGIIGAGNGAIKNILFDKIKQYKLQNNIKLLGYLDNFYSFSLIKSSKFFLFPSHEEGWGIAIAEAMGCKSPVISWNLDVYKEVFEDKTMQIEEGNINLFSEKIIQLLEDDNERKRRGTIGYEFIKKYSWDNVANNELKIIQEIYGL
jgi:glycosyltransferase involved in cell wall biosynthesis